MSETQTAPVAIVTGGSRGIGRMIVLTLAQAGYTVVFSYHSNKEAAESVIRDVMANNGIAKAISADASDPEQAKSLIENTHKEFGRIDAIINNAGITKDGLLIRMGNEDWDKVINTNLTGAFYTCKAAAKIMMKQRFGRIVNIASIVGVFGNAGQANYAASKAGLIGFTKSLAKELGSRNITANVVAPGFVETDMTEGLPTDELVSRVPLGRLGKSEDIAKAVAFLVTSGDYITGQVLQVDGGLVF